MTNDPTNPGVPDAEVPKTDVPPAADATAAAPAPATVPPAPAPLPPAAPSPVSAVKVTGIAASDGPKKPATTVTTGTLIMGTYEIEQLINSGGMGEVYRGRNIHNGEPVAIKIVLPSLAHDPKIVALFQKESTTLSRLSHEAIVRYHVFTVDPTIGRPCMVMEFVSGTAMSDRIEQGPMVAEDVRVMLRRVASGLDKAHRAGVVHRDLSPDNVILEEGMVEHAKLIDFGIAKSTAMGAGTLLQGQFAGKFNWVAPEQLGAFGGVVDGRSDIYSLALVTAGASRGEVLQMGASIVDAVGKRSSVPDLTGVDASLVPLLTWMLQPDPGQRPENMARVIAALDNPNLIPNATPPEPKAADPNRTIIGGALPAYEVLSAQSAKSAPPPAALPPVSKLPGTSDWDSPAEARKPTAPEGATVIASAGSFAPRAVTLPEEEPEDFSPFGAPSTAKPQPPAAVAASPKVAKKGAGGLIGVLAVLALGAGGAGAYFGGFLDAALIGANSAADDATPPVDAGKPVDNTAAVEAIAADDAAAAQLAEEKAAAEAALKLAADQEAAKLAEQQAAADALAAAEAAKLAEAEAAEDAAAAAVAAAELAKTQTAEEKAAADAAAAQKAVDDAAVAALAAEEAAAKLKADEAAAVEAAKAAEDAKLAADAAAQKVAEDAAAAEKLAAEEAAQKAAAEAAKADPVLSQKAFLASYVTPDCVYLGLSDPKPEGFVLDGFAADTKPLEQMSQEWTEATTTKPDVVVHLVSPGQCAALNFAVQFPDTAPKQPLKVVFDNPSAIVKNGSEIKGTVQGLEGRTLTLFYVTSKGTVTNVNKFTVAKDDGTVRFGFTMNIPKASASEPQVFLAIAGDKDVATFLNRLPEGKSAESVFKFVSAKLEQLALPTASALAFVQVDN